MSTGSSGLFRGVFLVACGAAAGAIAGGLVATNAPERRAVERRLTERVVELEQRLEQAEAAPPRRRLHVREPAGASTAADPVTGHAGADRPADEPTGSGGAAATTSAADGADGEGRVAVAPEFVQSVRAALDQIRREDARAKEIQGLRDERAKYVHDLDRRLANYQELLGLSDDQVEAIRATAQEGMDEILRARAQGVEGEELATLERARQREVRDLVGGATYREMRKLLLDEMARPVIVSVAGQAGVDKQQRDRIERLLDEHIEGLVDLDVRVRTEELSAEERQAIQAKMNDANRAAWDRLRNEILDAQQRERVPKRLR